MATKKVYEWEFDLEEYLMTQDVLEDYVARMKTRRTLTEDDLYLDEIRLCTSMRYASVPR